VRKRREVARRGVLNRIIVLPSARQHSSTSTSCFSFETSNNSSNIIFIVKQHTLWHSIDYTAPSSIELCIDIAKLHSFISGHAHKAARELVFLQTSIFHPTSTTQHFSRVLKMAGSGLAASIWSPHRHATTIYTSYTENYKTTIHVSRPGDWDCPSCGFSNFSFRTECLDCLFQRPHTGLQEVAGNMYKTSSASSQSENGAPSHAHPAQDVPVKPHAYSTPTIHSRVKNGLAMSYWAPLRDCSGANQTANGQKIRTKVCCRLQFVFTH
jgi:hypothetical protein